MEGCLGCWQTLQLLFFLVLKRKATRAEVIAAQLAYAQARCASLRVTTTVRRLGVTFASAGLIAWH
jgi:hypothetical protein